MTSPPRRRNAEEIVVFWLSRCDECGDELFKGNLLRKEGERGLCLSCADLDHLEWLPRGDAALTRRAGKSSRLRAVVLQWSSSRRRYERQGILAEPAAIEKAQKECLADADLREARRRRESTVPPMGFISHPLVNPLPFNRSKHRKKSA